MINYLYLLGDKLNLPATTLLQICPVAVKCEMQLSTGSVTKADTDNRKERKESAYAPSKLAAAETTVRTSYWREYKQRKRQQQHFRGEERIQELHAKQNARKDENYRQTERKRELCAKQNARKDDEYRWKELQSKQSARKDDEYRRKELQAKQSARKDDEYRRKELQAKQSARKEDECRQKDLQAKQSARKDDEYRKKELQAKQAARQCHAYRQQECERETAYKKRKRSDDMYCEQERANKKQKRLENQLASKKDRIPRGEEDSDHLHEEHAEQKTKLRSTSLSYEKCKEKFYNSLRNGPTYVCTSCNQTFFKHSVSHVKKCSLP